MSNCAVCHKPVKSGIVIHSECMPRWISVEKRLPDEELKQFRIKYPKEEAVEVIVVITGASESTTLYWNGHCFEDLSGEPYSVSHWMPLPAPPEVGT